MTACLTFNKLINLSELIPCDLPEQQIHYEVFRLLYYICFKMGIMVMV